MTLGHMPEAAKNNEFVSLARQSTLRELTQFATYVPETVIHTAKRK